MTNVSDKAPPFAPQSQFIPGRSGRMDPAPDRGEASYGEASYKGSGRLAGKLALITGGDSGIGRAVAIAFAREGADFAISYLDEHEDAAETKSWVEKAGRRCTLIAGDICDAGHCQHLEKAVADLGGLDILVNNVAYQTATASFDDITIEDWGRTFQTNTNATFYITKFAITKFAVPYIGEGGVIVNTSSLNAKKPMATLIPYSATKAAIANFALSLAQSLAARGIRANAVLPGPIWTPFIPSGMMPDQVKGFGSETPFKRPGQPAELAAAYVMLASGESSYTSGAMVVASGGSPIF